MTLYYLPIEPYEERYTKQLDEWVIEALEKRGIDYKRISGTVKDDKIRYGQVLDAVGRPLWCFEQARQLLELLQNGELKSGDKIFATDIWQFGLEGVAYASKLMDKSVEFYGINYAGTFEFYDFLNLRGLTPWAKYYEKMLFEWATKVFFGSEKLREMAIRAGMFSDYRKAVLTGLAFNSKYILKMVGIEKEEDRLKIQKDNIVVFPHRWDFEKNPQVFLDVVKYVKEREPDIEFIITTSRKEFGGTYPIEEALKMEKEGLLKIYKGLSKLEYYRLLLKSKIIFSSAKQDTVGYAMLESITLGCVPVVNYGVSYEEYLPRIYLYTDGAIEEAGDKIIEFINKPPKDAYPYIKRYDKSLDRMLDEMGY